MIASVIAEVNRDKKNKPKPFTLDDFLLDFKKKPNKVSNKSTIKAKAKGFLGMIGAKKKEKK